MLRFEVNWVVYFNLFKFRSALGCINWLNECICVFQLSRSCLADESISKLVKVLQTILNVIDLFCCDAAGALSESLIDAVYILASAWLFRPKLSQFSWTIRITTTVVVTSSRSNITSACSEGVNRLNWNRVFILVYLQKRVKL
jgi:hypothetical protein